MTVTHQVQLSKQTSTHHLQDNISSFKGMPDCRCKRIKTFLVACLFGRRLFDAMGAKKLSGDPQSGHPKSNLGVSKISPQSVMERGLVQCGQGGDVFFRCGHRQFYLNKFQMIV